MTTARLGFLTGAASGLGLAMANRLAEQGSDLFLTDIDADRLGTEAARIRFDYGVSIEHCPLDVSDRHAWAAAMEICQVRCGVPDLLILNAGVTTAGVPVEQIDPDDWEWLFSINVRGVLYGIQTVLPHMRAAGGTARIITVASILAHFGLAGAADYVASKHALLGLSESLQLELEGSGISVTVACPGLVQTRLSSSRARRGPAGTLPATDSAAKRPPGMAPSAAACIILAAAQRGDYFAYTHPEYREAVASRYQGAIQMMDIPVTGEDAEFLAGGAMRLHASQSKDNV